LIFYAIYFEAKTDESFCSHPVAETQKVLSQVLQRSSRALFFSWRQKILLFQSDKSQFETLSPDDAENASTGAMVIATTSGKEDSGFDSRQGVRF
jgi:hypothetical protein